MGQDTDVARVAAALRSPAIRYRSFGNEPVRTPLPAPEPDQHALLGAAMTAAAESADTPSDLPPPEAWNVPVAEAEPAPAAWAEPATTWAAPTPAPAWSESAAPPAWPAQSWPAPAATPAPAWPEPAPAPAWPAQSWTTPTPAPAPWPQPAEPQLPEPTAWAAPPVPSWPQQPVPMPAPSLTAPPVTGSVARRIEPVLPPLPGLAALPPLPGLSPAPVENRAEARVEDRTVWVPPPAALPPAAAAPVAPTEARGWTPSPPVPQPAPAAAPQLAPAALSRPAPAALPQPAPAALPQPAPAAPALADPLLAAPLLVVPPPIPAPPPAPALDGGVAAMTLLRAADRVEVSASAPTRAALSTLAALSISPAPPATTFVAAVPKPRALFPLIEALDLPGGLMARRDPAARPALPGPPISPLVPASAVDTPLPDLLSLIAAGRAAPDEAFTAMRRPLRADRPTT